MIDYWKLLENRFLSGHHFGKLNCSKILNKEPKQRSSIMMLERILWVTLLSGLIILLAMNHLSLNNNDHSSGKVFNYRSAASQESFDRLIELVKIQNETINTLEQKLMSPDSGGSPFTPVVQVREITKTVVQKSEFPTLISKDRQACEARYGMDLASIWKKNEEIWCEDTSNSELRSQLKCYPYHQAHKKLDGRTADLICEAYNFVVDFSKVRWSLLWKEKRLFQSFS